MIAIAKKLYELMTPSEKRYLIFLAFMLTGMACFETIGVASVMPFLALVGDPSIIETNKWLARIYQWVEPESQKMFILYTGMFSLAMLVLSNGIRLLASWTQIRFTHFFNYTLSLRMFRLYLLQPYSFFLTHNSSEMGKNVLDEAAAISSQVLFSILIVVSRTIVIVAIILFILSQEPLLSLLLIVCFGGCYMTAYLLTRKRTKTVGKKRTEAQSGRFRIANDAYRSVKEIKSGNRERFFYDMFEVKALSFAKQCTSYEVIAATPRFIMEIVAFGSMIVLVMWVVASGLGLGEFLPLLGMFAFGGFKMMPAMQQVFGAITAMRFYAPTLDLLYDDFSAYKRTEQELAEGTDELRFERELGLSKVRFAYSPESGNILDKLDLAISKNEMIGFVGSTGSGKTTTIDLLMGLIVPDEGQLQVDGIPVDDDNVWAWRKHIGYVPQSISLLDDTVRMNIAFGLKESEIDDEKVIKAARIANIHDHIVNNMPDGYDSIVGEQGVRLSGGQRQRIGIARAMYNDPDVLILDEATSALDAETEKSVMDSIKALAGAKTIIMVAHRISTLSECDRIIVLESGKRARAITYEQLCNGGAGISPSKSDQQTPSPDVSGHLTEGC